MSLSLAWFAMVHDYLDYYDLGLWSLSSCCLARLWTDLVRIGVLVVMPLSWRKMTVVVC